MMCLWVLGVLQ
jgi:hypothetical protein